MLQKRLKKSATWAITIIIKCHFANSFLLFDRPMPPKNLINQNLLIKITKSTPLQIRNKPKSLKKYQCEKQLKNTVFLSATNKQLQICIDLIQNQLKSDSQFYRDLFQRISRLLLEIKIKWQPIDEQKIEPESDQPQQPHFRVVKKNSSKYFSRNKLEIQEQNKVSERVFSTEKSGTENKQKKLIKAKIGKQNSFHLFGANESKIEKPACKLEQAQNLLKLQKADIQRLHQQIQNMLETNQRLKKQKDQCQQQKKSLACKMSCVIKQKLAYQSTCEENTRTYKKKEQQSMSLIALLRGFLVQREKQITAIWQLQIF